MLTCLRAEMTPGPGKEWTVTKSDHSLIANKPPQYCDDTV